MLLARFLRKLGRNTAFPLSLFAVINGAIKAHGAEECWSPRKSHTVTAFQNELWIVGGVSRQLGVPPPGWSHEDTYSRPAWHSQDGKSWTRSVIAPDELPREGHAAFVLKDRLWILAGERYSVESGGEMHGLLMNGATFDGANWNVLDKTALKSAWLPRVYTKTAAFRGRIWIAGGYSAWPIEKRAVSSDLWSSDDGYQWTLASSHIGPDFMKDFKAGNGRALDMSNTISEGSLEAFGDKLFLLLGVGVWSSETGEHWSQVLSEVPWQGRRFFRTVVHRKRLFLIGGSSLAGNDTQYHNDVWTSENGLDWLKVNTTGTWTGRQGHALVGFQDRMWILGGMGEGPNGIELLNDVWSSADGIDWTLIRASDPDPYNRRRR